MLYFAKVVILLRSMCRKRAGKGKGRLQNLQMLCKRSSLHLGQGCLPLTKWSTLFVANILKKVLLRLENRADLRLYQL